MMQEGGTADVGNEDHSEAHHRSKGRNAIAAVMKHAFGLHPNENKMSDGGRERGSVGVNGWKSSQS